VDDADATTNANVNLARKSARNDQSVQQKKLALLKQRTSSPSFCRVSQFQNISLEVKPPK
jgi:hypothetical protein